jgi:hypothetical protein
MLYAKVECCHLNLDAKRLNGTHQRLVYADYVNVLGRTIHTIEENTKALVDASKETRLEVNADKTKCMVMSRDHNAGQSHSMKIDNSSFERVEELKYLGTALLNQNSIQEEIKRRFKSGNACYLQCRTFCLPVCYLTI